MSTVVYAFFAGFGFCTVAVDCVRGSASGTTTVRAILSTALLALSLATVWLPK